MAPRRRSTLPRYLWDSRAGEYRVRETGRFLSREAVRVAVDDFIDTTAVRIKSISDGFRAGSVSFSDWERQMRTMIKESHLYTSALAHGGWDRMTPAAYGEVGNIVKDQYRFLRRFIDEIESGKQPLDGFFIERSKMYAEASRGTYYDFLDEQVAIRGYTEERSILRPGESCTECVEEAGKGWQKLGTLKRIGDRLCRANCRCSKQYRRR